MTALPYLESLGDGLYAIDTGFHRRRYDAAYLMVEEGRAAFIDTGTNFAVPRLLAALDALGLSVDDVDYVIPTHVHLDHAGGAGLLMQSLPRATLLVQQRGARHLIDPTALHLSALQVYGADEMARSYGVLRPIDAARVRSPADGDTVVLAGRPLHFIDTPGHARHHHCIWDERTRGWFTGDTFGMSFREFDTALGAWILPTTTPVQFEPDALRRSIERLLAASPHCMYLTHYSRVHDVQRLGGLLFEQIDAMVALARPLRAADDRHARLMSGLSALYREQLQRHGVHDPDAGIATLALDIELNAQGLAIWLGRGAR
ncbi:MBL fold metallo-hydrolase [Aquabacterium sp.]|uniref:MBL fold metallo-hydrolase n=1 Tax=Aquabacterium sp. TaxID=1872578 RepID=UPI002B7B420C|nr:MBL fold metallo-hydrolase [Aquabacterium sp.]HSW09209.1 MBL fold metallo-hydrolase [Aquabacterium sp.]